MMIYCPHCKCSMFGDSSETVKCPNCYHSFTVTISATEQAMLNKQSTALNIPRVHDQQWEAADAEIARLTALLESTNDDVISREATIELLEAEIEQLRKDRQSARVTQLETKVARLTALLIKIPKREDIELAIRANNSGGLEFRPEYCRCDPDVGMSPCPYCAIDGLLRRVLNVADAILGPPCPWCGLTGVIIGSGPSGIYYEWACGSRKTGQEPWQSDGCKVSELEVKVDRLTTMTTAQHSQRRTIVLLDGEMLITCPCGNVFTFRKSHSPPGLGSFDFLK